MKQHTPSLALLSRAHIQAAAIQQCLAARSLRTRNSSPHVADTTATAECPHRASGWPRYELASTQRARTLFSMGGGCRRSQPRLRLCAEGEGERRAPGAAAEHLTDSPERQQIAGRAIALQQQACSRGWPRPPAWRQRRQQRAPLYEVEPRAAPSAHPSTST